MSLTKATYSMIDAPVLNLRDYGAVGDGIANDTAAWLAFKSACATTGSKGILPAGNYLIDAFTFDGSDAGLILEGTAANAQSPSPEGPGPGRFGAPIAVLRLRTAGTKFVSFSGAYNMTISNLAFDGNQFADNLLYWDGIINNTYVTFNHCSFYGATPLTGVNHRYDGFNGGNNIYYNYCFLSQARTFGNTTGGYGIRNTNGNAFLIDYISCQFWGFDIGASYEVGSCNLYDCAMYLTQTAMIEVINVAQAFIVTNFYSEQSNGSFLVTTFTAGVNIARVITIINANIAANNPSLLNCQQPVNIFGGTFGGDIVVEPVAIYGIHSVIIDSAGFPPGRGITGSGAVTRTHTRNTFAGNVSLTTQDYGSLRLAKVSASANSGAVLAATNQTWLNVSNSSPQNVTGLTGGLVGQEILLFFLDANTTLINSATFILQGSANVTPTAFSIIKFLGSGAAPGLAPIYWNEISRSIK